MSLVCKAVGKTDIGLVRSGNEDYLQLDPQNNVFAVCDGMGGHAAGEVASMTAAEIVSISFSNFSKELIEDETLAFGRTLPDSGDILVKSIRLSNREIYNRAQTDSSLSGMGTTIVAVSLEADYMSIAHVGDSRAYKIEDRQLVQLTTDHSWVQELQDSQRIDLSETDVSVGKNVITRALGVRHDVEVDYRLIKVKAGDKFMLCSDGLCGFADNDEIFDVIKRAEGNIEKITDLLVKMANDRGGMDNVTVAVIEIEKVEGSPIEECETFTTSAESPELLRIEDIWLQKINTKRQEIAEMDDKPPAEKKTPDKKVILAIFAGFFIIVLLLALIFSQGVSYLRARGEGLGVFSKAGLMTRTERVISVTPIPSGAGSVRHMNYHGETGTVWFGTDRSTLGRARVRLK